MTPANRKPFFSCILYLLLMAGFIFSCSKPHHEIYPLISTTAADSTAKADSIPSFNSPHGIALDASGNIYVADYGNNLIRKITPAGVVSTYAGSGSQGSVNGAASVASFSGPASITLDAGGNMYVADLGNNLIRKITASGVVSTLAGTDTIGEANGPGAQASFFSPSGVVVDGTGNVYVADAGNNVIRLITPAGVVSNYAGNGNPAYTDGAADSAAFFNPTGLAIDAKGNIFVADYLNNVIRSISSGIVSTLAGTGTIGAANGPGNAATFYFPKGVAVDGSANVYVADEVNNLIRKIDQSGNVTTLAGSGLQGAVDTTGTAASFNAPAGLAVDASGNVYVADANNNLIRKITPAGVVTTVAGTGLAGAINGKVLVSRKRLLKIAQKSSALLNK